MFKKVMSSIGSVDKSPTSPLFLLYHKGEVFRAFVNRSLIIPYSHNYIAIKSIISILILIVETTYICFISKLKKFAL